MWTQYKYKEKLNKSEEKIMAESFLWWFYLLHQYPLRFYLKKKWERSGFGSTWSQRYMNRDTAP